MAKKEKKIVEAKVEDKKVTEAPKNEKANKKETKPKKEKKAKKEKEVGSFSFFRFLLHLIVFALSITLLYFAINFALGGITALSGMTVEVTSAVFSVVVVFGFVVAMAEFQLGWRRFFRIGRKERIEKLEAKKAKKDAKKIG